MAGKLKKPQKKTPARKKTPASKKPAKPKSLVTAEKRLAAATAEAGKLKKELSDQRAKATAAGTGTGEWDKVRAIQKKLDAAKATAANARNMRSNGLSSYSKTLEKAGFTGAAATQRAQAAQAKAKVQNQRDRAYLRNQTEASKQAQETLEGGIKGLITAVNEGSGAAAKTGQDIVDMNLGETRTGTEGLSDILGGVTADQSAATAAAQRAQVANISGNAKATRTALQNLSPEVARATGLFARAATRTQNLAQPTNRMTRKGLNQQSELAQKAMRQAGNYIDPTTGEVRKAGNQMMAAAKQSEKLADKATSQALNYIDPTTGEVRKVSNQMMAAAKQSEKLADKATSQALNYIDPTTGEVRKAGNQMMAAARRSEKLADKATSQALNYIDPTTGEVRKAGNEMFSAAAGTSSLANQATNQALNYKDPTAALAQQAISGYQGLAGLQQRAAEDAYARARQLTPEQMREADQSARESFAARGMLGSTGSVASEILNRESSIAARRGEAAGMGQLAQMGQQGLVGLASGYESDALARRTGLQQSAAGLQNLAGQQYGQAGGFVSDAETARLGRRTNLQQSAQGMQGAAGAQYGQAGSFISAAESDRLNRRTNLQQSAQGMQGAAGAQYGQVGSFVSAAESDRLNRRTGLQQSALGMQGATGQQYGQAGAFVSGSESDMLARQQQMRANAMGLSQSALGAQQSVRGEARQGRSDLYDTGQFYTNFGLPLLTQQTSGQQMGLGLLSAGLGMSGQGSGLLQAGSNIGMSQWTTQQEKDAAFKSAQAQKDAGRMGGIGGALGGLFSIF